MKCLGVVGGVLCFTLLQSAAFALEVDQFVAIGKPLKDMGGVFNDYLNREMEKVLTHVNRKPQRYACEEIVEEFLGREDITGVLNKIEVFAFDDPSVDTYPPRLFNQAQAIEVSIYQKAFKGRWLPLARTVEIDGIRVGTDKLSHFLSMGLTYYQIYRSSLRSGQSEEQAMTRAIERGIYSEETYYGYLSSGVFSFADLESNFQGMLFARSLCEGFAPVLYKKSSDGTWTLSRPLDLRPWVNPYWDETFNPNHYTTSRWADVAPYLKGYCGLLRDPGYLEQEKRYRKRAAPSFSVRYLEQKVREKKLNNPTAQSSLGAVCGASK